MDFLLKINKELKPIADALVDPQAPASIPSDWTAGEWKLDGSHLVFESSSASIGQRCYQEPNSSLYLGSVVQGFHRVYADGKLAYSNGDITEQVGTAMYNFGSVPCHLLSGSKSITWKAYTSTHALARIRHYPFVSSQEPITNSLVESTSVGAVYSLIMATSIIILAYRKILQDSLLRHILFSSTLFSLFFAFTLPESFHITLSTLNLHRIHDMFLWLGTVFVWKIFDTHNLYNQTAKYFHYFCTTLGLLLILISTDLNVAQLGSNIAYVANIISSISVLCSALISRHRSIYFILSVASFCLAAINDLLYHSIGISTVPLFSVGATMSFLFLALQINQTVKETYRERDHLRENLELEVDKKTRDILEKTNALNEKSLSLETALTELKEAQAEALQSSKLASLGTLAAGIAHEINNSLNYVRGNIGPLKIAVDKLEIDDSKKIRIQKMTHLMEDGLKLTTEIILNLKRYSRSSDIDEVIDLKETTEGALLLLSGKIKESETKIEIDVPENCQISFSRVALCQIILNVVGNSIDALEEVSGREKVIKIKLENNESNYFIVIQDNGKGIPHEVLDKVCDPFFTTKTLGKGTGLGLHIVQSEMVKRGGKVKIQSQENIGTKISLSFPIKESERLAS